MEDAIMQKVIRPPNEHLVTKNEIQHPLVFLGGPIKGAADWQQGAIAYFGDNNSDAIVASPRTDAWDKDMTDQERSELYIKQTDWEHKYLDYALRHGVVMFWLAKPEKEVPGRAYAQTSRFELGFCVAQTLVVKQVNFDGSFSPRRLIVGAHPEFSNRRYIARALGKSSSVLYDTLDETLEHTSRFLQAVCGV